MTGTAAIVALLATLAIGGAVGLRYLGRARKRGWVRAHLVAALGALALVVLAVLAPPPGRAGGAAGAWAVLLVGMAVAAGWSARRIARRSALGNDVALVGHVAAGIAGFLALLAFLRIA